jgi:imidazolonepropionase-like amidohydrolase
VLGTDAVAGAHGRNAEEFIYRVKDGGDKPMDALMSGTSVAAESLGMADRIGSLALREWKPTSWRRRAIRSTISRRCATSCS